MLAGILLFLLASCPLAPPPVTSLVDGVTLVPAFPRLRFRRPVFLTHAPGDERRVFVLEQRGLVHVFESRDDVSETQVFLDLSDRVSRAGNEEGLLGLAFHPNYARNGTFFVHYSSSRRREGIVSRFRVSPDDPERADPGSEEVLLRQPQPWRNHNGGMLAFGPDGYLYLSFGDGGAAGDPRGAAQRLDTWLGKILRIDVDRRDGGRAFAVPPDNPFVGRDGARPEIWAYGLRNVWRFSFDLGTGRLWAGDVGQDEVEEIDVIVKGGNYGWNAFEGPRRFRDGPPDRRDVIAPVAWYPAGEGRSVTGGYVYRGREVVALRGVYLLADYLSGTVWGLWPRPDGGFVRRRVLESRRAVASFGEDARGELYLCTFDDGLYRFAPAPGFERDAEPFPEHLSETGVFASLGDHRLVEGFIPYDVNVPLWADHAGKLRFVRVPDGARLGYHDSEAWDVPDGTVVVKTFVLPHDGRRLETRIIRRDGERWNAASFRWNDEQTDARLVRRRTSFDTGSGALPERWTIPSPADCRECHTPSAGFTLGLMTPQMNRGSPVEPGRNQIDQLVERGALSAPDRPAAALPRFPALADRAATLESRARAYLHANCAQCHHPGGPGNAVIDLRWDTPLAETGVVGGECTHGGLGVAGARIVAPGHPEKSVLLLRMQELPIGRMPPLGVRIVDEGALGVLADWIETLAE